jgi:arylsulfatase A-like enzyme
VSTRTGRPKRARAAVLSSRSSLADVVSAAAAALAAAKIDVVLTGGACASLHSRGRYASRDLDFVVIGSGSAEELDAAMGSVGFRRRANYYVHPRTRFFVEFLPAPLAIGADTAIRPATRILAGRRVRLLSPTDSCRDRLAAFYHWSDRQSLAVAIEIALANRVQIDAIKRWSAREGHARGFAEFVEAVAARRRERQRASRRTRGLAPQQGKTQRARRLAPPPRTALMLAAALIGAAIATGCGRDDERRADDRSMARDRGAGRPPNILLVTIDTFRADHLHAAGYARKTTPVIDSLAAAGALFTQAISPAPQTAPSHASMLTGAYPPAHTVRSNGIFALPEEATTIAEILSESGNETGAFVGAFVLDRRFGFAQGFDAFGDSMHAASTAAGDAGERAHVWYGNVVVDGAFERPAGAVTDEAIRWLEQLDGASPFFLWAHYYDPHAPYDPPDEHDIFPKHDSAATYAQWEEQEGASPHDHAAEEEGEAGSKDVPSENGREVPSKESGSKEEREAPSKNGGSKDVRKARGIETAADSARRAALREDMIALYDGEIRYCDAQVGRLIDALRARGAWNTLVIVTSDHGESLGESGYDFRHGWYLADNVLRVPLVITFPNVIPAGIVVNKQVELTEIFDTVRRAAVGDDGSGDAASRSLVDLARSMVPRPARAGSGAHATRPAAGTDFAYAETFLRKQLVGGPPLFAVRSTRWKYVEPIDEPGRTRRWLYDLAADPTETRNLAKQGPEMAAVADSMSAVLRAIRTASESEAVSSAHEIAPDEATIERLRALGYIK